MSRQNNASTNNHVPPFLKTLVSPLQHHVLYHFYLYKYILLNDNSATPTLDGYSFEHVNSTTKSGGVGVFLSNRIDYSIRNDLNLHCNGCEDLWIEIEVNKSYQN